MKAIIKFFLDNSKLTYLITLFLIVFGANGMKNLLREENPNVNIGQARITTYYPGATAEEVEIEVTKKIEDKIKEVSGIKKVRSVSQTNISIIKAEIDIDNFDQEEVMDDLKDAVEMVNNLPATASKPEFLEIDTKEFSVLEVAIVGSNENRKRDAYVEFLEDELKDVKGVLKIEKYGYAEREFTIKMNLEKLVQYNVGIDEVVDALQNKNISVPAGSLKSYENQALVRIDAKSKNKEELENILIRSNFEDKKVYIKDIAEVVDFIEDQEAYTKINGEDCTIMAIKKQSSVDTIHLSKEVKAKIEEYSKSEQGKDFKIIYFVNAAIDVESKFGIIVSNVVFGVVTVLIFMMIFLPGKIGIVSSMCLPIIVMATLGLMPILEINIDSISMLAIIIALGMMVDNSVLVSENFAQLIEEGNSIYNAALGCAAKFWIPITVTTLTTIFAFMPMLLTKGVMGLFISSIPILVSLTLAISIAECLFLMPARLRAIGGSIVKAQNKRKKSGKEGVDWFSTVIAKFEKLVYVCVSHRYISLCCFIGILMFSFYILGKSQFILFPPEDVDEYNVKYETGIGDSLEKTGELTTRLTNDIYNTIGRENIENIVAYIGQSGTGLLEDLQQNHHTAELKIYIYKEKSYILNYKDILTKLRNMDTSYLSKFEVTEESTGPDVGKAIEANFRSNNESKLYEVINYMKTELAKIDGIIDLESNDYKNDDEIFIRLDYEKIARIGLSTSYISNLIKASISGIEIAMITLNNREFSMLVKFDDSFKKYDKDLQKIKIRDNDGNLIPLAEIATIERVAGSRMKHRLNFKKNVALRANVNVNKITALEGNAKVVEIFDKVKDQYPEVSLQFGGEQENAEESFSSLVIAFKFAFILIIGCLVFVLNSYVKPLIIMTTVPLGVVGFAIAFYLHQRPISFLAVIGVIGLVGVVTDVGIILISFVDMLRKQYKKTMTLNQILAKASGARLRAVVASAVTTVSGLLPTAYGIGGRDASLIPVTLAMAWGLVSSTLLSLLWMPCAYGIMDDGYQLLRKARVGFWKFRRRKIN